MIKRKNIVGKLINFRGLVYAPVEENGVIFLFGKITKDLGMYIETIRRGFPDCIAKRYIGGGQWEEMNIEFEFNSSDFKRHGHLDSMKQGVKCDMIVCWNHDWKECPKDIEVIELEKEYKNYPNEELDITKPVKTEKISKFKEGDHFAHSGKEMVSIYHHLKESIAKFNENIQINPQKYYISLRDNKNFAYIYFKKKKIWITVMLTMKTVSEIVKKHKTLEEGEGVQRFYGGPCVSIMIENENNFDEIIKAVKEAYNQQNKQ